MRLLYQDEKGFAFHEVADASDVKYAILSHRWYPEGDILLADIANQHHPHIASKKGWQKIRFAMQQAEKDRCPYVWIDTCCIDKTSSAELSEAINSMFFWYQEARVCYAYLWDVDGSCPMLYDPSVNQPSWLADWRACFLKSEWFLRGWTLQELIAPRLVNFYGEQWNLLGRSVDLANSIASVTGIPSAVLTHQQKLTSFSVAQRMSWAANRQTSRIEDLSYCLLGLFDINMPMLYGERHKAFTRLQQEIIKTTADQFDQGQIELDMTGLKASFQGVEFLDGILQAPLNCHDEKGQGMALNLAGLGPSVFVTQPGGDPPSLFKRHTVWVYAGGKFPLAVARYDRANVKHCSGRVSAQQPLSKARYHNCRILLSVDDRPSYWGAPPLLVLRRDTLEPDLLSISETYPETPDAGDDLPAWSSERSLRLSLAQDYIAAIAFHHGPRHARRIHVGVVVGNITYDESLGMHTFLGSLLAVRGGDIDGVCRSVNKHHGERFQPMKDGTAGSSSPHFTELRAHKRFEDGFRFELCLTVTGDAGAPEVVLEVATETPAPVKLFGRARSRLRVMRRS